MRTTERDKVNRQKGDYSRRLAPFEATARWPFLISELINIEHKRHLTLGLFTNYNHTLAYAWGVHALSDIWAVQVIASKEEEVLDVHLLLRRNISKPDGLKSCTKFIIGQRRSLSRITLTCTKISTNLRHGCIAQSSPRSSLIDSSINRGRLPAPYAVRAMG